jgi:hypothetical protein
MPAFRAEGTMITRTLVAWLSVLVWALAPLSVAAQVSPDDPLEIVAPAELAVFDAYPVEIRLQLDPSVVQGSLAVQLNGQDITGLFQPTLVPGELSAQVGPEHGLAVGVAGTKNPDKDGINALRTVVRSSVTDKKDRDYGSFFVILPEGSTTPVNPLTILSPDQGEVFTRTPVELMVNVDDSADPATFQAKLNGLDISA